VRIVIGYVGVIGVQDGVDYLLRALASLKDDFHCHDFRAVIVGSGPALPELQRLAKQLNLDDCLVFAGYRVGDDLLRHLASFDICVTPDPSNAYNDSCTTVKTMEYMATARPVVAFDLPENRLTLADAGLYADGNNARELAKNIHRLIENPQLRARLGQIGRQRVLDYFRWEKQQTTLIQLYDNLFGESRETRSFHAAGDRADAIAHAPELQAVAAAASGSPPGSGS
jgi:glycosyltransferase involved in cell wall biosynthesis